ncbi:MAG TPA: (2Fe-2S)-binding protein [Acidimicrobiales bacterium]|jgi:ferric iron reductase protein FhuF|nr:(2Fe-2S)-binding protein [Acidimicrobiales bacterium]
MDACELLAQVTAAVDYLRVSTGPAPAGRQWLRCGPLVSEPDALLALVRSTAAGRGTDRDDVAMSLFVQGYSFRVASIAVGGWLVGDAVIDVSPASTSIALGRDRPNAVHLDDPRLVEADLHDHLIGRHLALLVDTAHRACRVGEPLLWGNVGASCAASFAAFVDPLPDRRAEIRDRAELFFATARPELARSGRVVRVGSRWAWERTACCLWYQTESGFKCEDCSLWSTADRAARYAAMQTDEAQIEEASQ